MLKRQRQAYILDLLVRNKFVRVEDLAKDLNVSVVTIRRDISELDEKNKLIKVHGGAQVLKGSQDIELQDRHDQNPKAKIKIAKKAATYVKDGQSIYLDAGTTCSAVIPFLSQKDIIVYTHGIHHVQELQKHNIETYVLGGKIKRKTHAAIGALTLKYLEHMSFDVAFIGFNAYDNDFGYTTPDDQEAFIKEKIIAQSDKVLFLGDKTKFNRRAGIHFANVDDGVLITND